MHVVALDTAPHGKLRVDPSEMATSHVVDPI
jgi:hypothetical protein